VYLHADLVTYPSDIEGFGNAFLEAIYYRRPIVVNNYSIFDIDIKPKGFRVIEFDGYITQETVRRVLQVLRDPHLAQEMTEHNYERASVTTLLLCSSVACRHSSQTVLANVGVNKKPGF